MEKISTLFLKFMFKIVKEVMVKDFTYSYEIIGVNRFSFEQFVNGTIITTILTSEPCHCSFLTFYLILYKLTYMHKKRELFVYLTLEGPAKNLYP